MKTSIIFLLALTLVSAYNLRGDPSTLFVPSCQALSTKTSIANFTDGFIPQMYNLNGTSYSNIGTTVQVCHNNFSQLNITWVVEDPFVNTQNGDKLSEEDLVEAFFGAPQDYLSDYCEYERYPSGYFELICYKNALNNCDDLLDNHLDSPEIQVRSTEAVSQADKTTITSQGYSTTGLFPIKFIIGTQTTTHLRANFCRTGQTESGEINQACWRPTYISPPCLNVPSQFGNIFLI